MFYTGDIIKFKEVIPKLNWFKKLFYKYEQPYISSYKKLDNRLDNSTKTVEYRILLKNDDIFEVMYRNHNTLLLKKLNVTSDSDFCEFDPYLTYKEKLFRPIGGSSYNCPQLLHGEFENFILTSKEDIKRIERKQKLKRINENWR